jgi:alpha-N-dichloroacetyl-p-aminophenylserinol N-oxygenase
MTEMHLDQTQEIIALDRKVMARMAATWGDRVAVRKDRLDLSQYYDPGIPDFPVEIIPFGEDREFRAVFDGQSEQARLRFLAATWIAYNERVIFIEDDVVQPFCTLLRKKLLPGVNDEVIQQVIVQSQVDEQFHTLMCLEVCSSARERHRLSDYVLPPPLLGRRIREQLVTTDDAFEHALILMSYATISESTIHDYLRKLSTITSIQPLNRIHTEMHRRDEAAHGTIFLEIARSVYRNLDSERERALLSFFSKALHDSVEIDMSFWSSTLPYLEARNWRVFIERVGRDLSRKRIGRDYGALLHLLDELGVRDKVDFSFS